MAIKKLIPVEVLKQLLHCNPETGKLIWRTRPVSMFFASGQHSQQHNANVWNSKFANKEALFSLDRKGYLHGLVFRNQYRTHRVIWALHYGEWPFDQIDHINHIRTDNRIKNLRVVTLRQNSQNIKLRHNNRTGHCGVIWNRLTQSWRARINVDGKQIHLGLFSTKEEAANARQAANVKYGFHKNHGQAMD